MLRPHRAGVSPRQLGPRQPLGLLDIGLIECVHAEPLTQLPRCVLPLQEFCAQVERVAREFGERLDIGPALAHGVVDDGHHAAPVLARALGHELLDPVRESRDAGRRPQDELVAPRLRRRREPRPHCPGAIAVYGLCPLEQRPPIHADQGRGEHPHDRERRVAAAHVHRVREHAPKAALAGQRLERRAGLGDRDELLRSRPGGEVMVERERLDGRPRLAADDEDGVPDPGAVDREHGRRIGAVEGGEGSLAAALSVVAVISGAYLLESHGYGWAAAALVAAGVAAGAARFLASSRADRRYAKVLENEVATQTRSLVDSLTATADAERRLRLVMDAVPDAIAVLDRDGRVIDLNESAKRLLAAPLHEGTGRKVFASLEPDAAAIVRERLAAAFRGEVQRFEV